MATTNRISNLPQPSTIGPCAVCIMPLTCSCSCGLRGKGDRKRILKPPTAKYSRPSGTLSHLYAGMVSMSQDEHSHCSNRFVGSNFIRKTLLSYSGVWVKKKNHFAHSAVRPPFPPSSKLKLQRTWMRRPAKKKANLVQPCAATPVNFEFWGNGGRAQHKTLKKFLPFFFRKHRVAS